MQKPNPDIGKGLLYVPEQMGAPALPADFDLDRQTSFSHLISVISYSMDLPPAYTNEEDLARVDPASIQAGLQFDIHEAIRRRYKHVIRGVGFSAGQFLQIARSPSDLADHAYTHAEDANVARPPEERLDRDEQHATASRSAGHSLVEHVTKLETARQQLSEQRLALLALRKAIKAKGYAHWPGRYLDGLRKTASDIIHGHIEIAAVNLPWNHQTADDLQGALHYNLYGRAGRNNVRLGYWDRYVLMSGLHTRNQLEVVKVALLRTTRELEKYQPYLDAKKQAGEEAEANASRL